jgi:hypothetical protein
MFKLNFKVVSILWLVHLLSLVESNISFVLGLVPILGLVDITETNFPFDFNWQVLVLILIF